MTQTRRELLKTAAGGIALSVTTPSLMMFAASPSDAAVVAPTDDWSAGPGKARHRFEGWAKVTGQKIYARDFRAGDLPGWPARQSYVLVLRATFADRIFAGLDLDRLPPELRPKQVITAHDLKRDGIGIAEEDYPEGRYLVPEGERPDYLGQEVALLVYDDHATHARAREAIRATGAIRAGAKAVVPAPSNYQPVTEIVHVEEGREQAFAQTRQGIVDLDKPGAQTDEAQAEIENVARAFANPDWKVLSRSYATQVQDPMFMEPESGLAWRDPSGKLHLVIGTQSPWYDARSAAELFAGPDCKIGVTEVDLTACYLGGGFGGRDTSILCLFLALAAAYVDGPVRIAYDRFEQFQCGVKRSAVRFDVELAVDDTGRFQAIRNQIVLDGGGRVNVSTYVAQVAAIMGAGCYDVPLAHIRSRAEQTRAPVAGSMRGFGASETTVAVESLIDEVASELDIDAIELRLRNVLEPDEPVVTGAPHAPPGLRAMCEQARAHRLWRDRHFDQAARSGAEHAYGVGFAIAMKNYGTGADAVFAEVAIDRDGRIVVASNAVDMGTGTATVLALAPASILGANASVYDAGGTNRFQLLQLEEGFEQQPDNPRWTPIAHMSTKASTTSSKWVHGVEQASRMLLETGLLPAARSLWGDRARGVSSDRVRWRDGALTAPGLAPISLARLARHAHDRGYVVAAMVHGFFSGGWNAASFAVDGVTVRPEIDALAVRRGGSPDFELIDRKDPTFYTAESVFEGNGQRFGASACLVAVEVDRRSGEVRVREGVHFLGPGKVLQRDLVDGQIDGSIAMGVGFALLEDLPEFEAGSAGGDWNLHRYHVPLARDCAIHAFEKRVFPPESPDAPARGIAEVAFCPVAPAIANAVAHATGRRFRELPITPDKVRAAGS